MYGASSGLDVDRTATYDSETEGIPGSISQSGYFGRGLATGDFDGDDADDLAIGVSGADSTTGVGDAGAFVVLSGASASGLSTSAVQYFDRDTSGVPGAAAGSEYFAHVLTAGDFDGDDRDDLAITAYHETSDDDDTWAGGMVVMYGSSSGLATSGAQSFDQDTEGIPVDTEATEAFGVNVAAGDVNGDGIDELLVGNAQEGFGEAWDAGQVVVVAGRAEDGLNIGNYNRGITQATPGINGTPEKGDYFGSSLWVGDANGDGRDDVGVGAMGENFGAAIDGGVLDLIYGGRWGLTSRDQQWSEDSSGVLGRAEMFDYFSGGEVS